MPQTIQKTPEAEFIYLYGHAVQLQDLSSPTGDQTHTLKNAVDAKS